MTALFSLIIKYADGSKIEHGNISFFRAESIIVTNHADEDEIAEIVIKRVS